MKVERAEKGVQLIDHVTKQNGDLVSGVHVVHGSTPGQHLQGQNVIKY